MSDPDPKTSKTKPREFIIANSDHNSKIYESNYISTTKYTALSFFPLCLMGQFKRYANIYFTVMAVIQCFPAISPINPVSSIAPLIFVISLSIIREGFEDLSRHKSDLELNSSKTARYFKGEWITCDWKDAFVGDFIKVVRDEFFPTDMICVKSSDPEGNCFIQTSSLDGEKNLKPRMAITETQASMENPNLIRLMGEVEIEPPNSDLYSCNGTISFGGDRKISLSNKNLLLRGSVLKNTDWVIGVTAYTGKDTKIMKNAEEAKFKQSQIEVKTNNLIIVIFFFQVIICAIAAGLNSVWYTQNRERYQIFFNTSNNPHLEAFFLFLTMLILTGTMIPISLIVSLEMVKLVQAFFINNDQDMYFEENERFCKVFTSTLNEELGQIEFIFSDKTGTLTCNKMEFKHCVIGDVLYGKYDSNEPAKPKPEEPEKTKDGKPKKHEHVSYNFKDNRLNNIQQGKIEENKSVKLSLSYRDDPECKKPIVTYETQLDLFKEFLLLLSVCHDCLVDTDEDGVSSYQGQSPDEITLVDAAKRLGYEYLRATSTSKIVKIFGETTSIKFLKFFEFNSDRKRASVIIKDEHGVIKLMTKGADSIIIDRLATKKPQPYLAQMKKDLTKFSTVGLRTLCMAERVLTQEEYDVLDQKMLEAANAPNRDKLIGKVLSSRCARSRSRARPDLDRLHGGRGQAAERGARDDPRHAQGRHQGVDAHGRQARNGRKHRLQLQAHPGRLREAVHRRNRRPRG